MTIGSHDGALKDDRLSLVPLSSKKTKEVSFLPFELWGEGVVVGKKLYASGPGLHLRSQEN